jgi:hypothetical protein
MIFNLKSKRRNLNNEYFDYMNLHALSMLLIEKASEYFEILEQKETNGFKVRDLRRQIEIIQEVIELRRSEKLRNSLLFQASLYSSGKLKNK